MTSDRKPPEFIISGAGIIGPLLANALKARNIPFVILERDTSLEFREKSGWAITLHYALEAFKNLVPKQKMDPLYDSQVRPNFHKSDSGNFKYINASTGEVVVCIPPSSRIRVRREQVRRVLLDGLEVEWDSKVESIDYHDDLVSVTCSNGKQYTGDVLIGCDGSNSITRRLIDPKEGGLYQLPIRFCGARVQLNKEEFDRISNHFDPLLFQGTVPETNTFFWYSALATPEYTKAPDLYYAQVNLSWNVPETDEPFETQEQKANALKKHSQGLSPELSWLVDRAVQNPEELMEIKLCDWEKVDWDDHDGKVLLALDSLHPMTMYRGSACNEGILDVAELVKQLDLHLQGLFSWKDAVANYRNSVQERARQAVLLSRQACLDAHDMSKITPNSTSPLLSVRKSK